MSTTRADVMGSWYLASLVKRYHTWPTITTETVGQHSHGVAMIWCRLFGSDPDDLLRSGLMHARVLRYILEHDLAELWTGDLPFPFKKRYPDVARALVTAEYEASAALGLAKGVHSDSSEKVRMKVCDLLQMHLFGACELRMGNQYARPIAMDTLSAALLLAGSAGDDFAVTQINKFVEENPIDD